MGIIQNRYDFVGLFDISYGNPNGDPDLDNAPRMDPETGIGIVTDVCLKHKVRDYISLVKGNAPGYSMYISDDASLNRKDAKLLKGVLRDSGIQIGEKEDSKTLLKKGGNSPGFVPSLLEAACATYYDIRAFGGVMTTFSGAPGFRQVRGPIQLGFATSVEPISIMETTITRAALTTEADFSAKANTMGVKRVVPYGLYRVEGQVSASLAQKLAGPHGKGGLTEEDLELFWTSLMWMFEEDRSAIRPSMAMQQLIIFRHDSAVGNAPAHKLLPLVSVRKKEGVEFARQFSDYEVSIAEDQIPKGVTLQVRF